MIEDEKNVSEMRKELNNLLASLSMNGQINMASEIDRPSAEIIDLLEWKNNNIH